MARPLSGKKRREGLEINYSQYDMEYCIEKGILPKDRPGKPSPELVIRVLRKLLLKITTDNSGLGG